MKYNIRLKQEHDFSDILKIEKGCFDDPLSKEDFRELFARANVFCIVCEHHERVVGYLLYEIRRKHVALLSIAVDAKFRRKGIANAMLKPWANSMSYIKNKLTVIVREGNLPAQMLLKSVGFKATVILQSPYEGLDDNGYFMECDCKINQEM